jgi:hypothetical protein
MLNRLRSVCVATIGLGLVAVCVTVNAADKP